MGEKMRNHKLTVVVTGSEGFIGKHLCTALEVHPDVAKLIRFDKANRLEWNVYKDYDVSHYIAAKEPDIVFHLAANTTVKYKQGISEMDYLENICGMKVLLQNLHRHCRVVLASSVHVPYSQSLYAASKASCEALLSAYVNMGLIDGVILRLTSVVGQGMTHGVVKDFMGKLRSDSHTLDIIGEAPGSIRPYIHIDDVVNSFIYYGIEIDTFNIPYNITTTQAISVDKVADIVMQEMGIYKPKRWLGVASKWIGDVDEIRLCSKYPFPKESEAAIAQAVKDNL